MKFLIFLLLTTSVFANPDCDENGNPISSITALATPNCLNAKYLGPAIENNISNLCNNCKSNFQKFVKDPIVELNEKEKQDAFIDTALKEYQKNLIENLFDTLKLRGMRPTGASLSKSIQSCKMRSLEDFSKDCKSPKALQYLKKSETFKNFNDSISIELGKVLSQENNYYPEKTLLKRNKPNCFIPEQQLLYISISALEEVLTPQIINTLSSLDPTKYATIEDMFIDEKVDNALGPISAELDNILSSFKTHPLIADKFRTPASLSQFFKSIKEPKDVAKLRNEIYNKANGENFDLKLSKKCDNNYDALKKAICSTDFEQGKITLNPFQNYKKLFNKALNPSNEEFTTSQELEKQNLELLKLCDSKSETSKVQLSGVFNELNKTLNPNFVEQTLDSYKIDKHEMDLGKINENLCKRANENCNDNTYSCKILQKYKASKDPKSLDYKLANSSNEEVNKLLRSMIGDTSRIDVETKKILIAQGIIPKDDGTMVKQPDIPERQPEYFAKEQSQQPGQQQQTNPNVAKIGPSTNNSKASNSRNPASENTYDDSYSNVSSKSASQSQSNGPDFSDLMDNQQELRNVQDEIKRRLLGSNKPNEEEARKIVRESFKARKQPLSQDMEDAFTNRILDNNSPAPQNLANNSQTTTDEPNRAQVSGGESANAKWRKQQDQNALMGMAGAQQVLGKDSANSGAANADAKAKDLTKVALNLAEDPRVNLSELFNKKIDQNDSETQLLKVLLRNKNNFLLQIKAMNFKVVFDEKNNFNVLLESGDKQEAARIRPQLEMFLKKLKS